jgi:hypothetical protein
MPEENEEQKEEGRNRRHTGRHRQDRPNDHLTLFID